MVNKIYLNSTFAYREDSLKNWQTANPVLERGEISFVRDGYDGKFIKIGDGHTAWNALPYAPLPKGEKGDKGDKGEQGLKGDNGTNGKDGVNGKDGEDYILTQEDKEEIANMAKPTIDKTYSPDSENPQSGIAVAEVVETITKNPILDYISYEIENDKVYIIDCDKTIEGDYTIPKTIKGYPVTKISNAFVECDKLTSITIPDSVTDILDCAFQECASLSSITVGKGLSFIGDSAFHRCPKLANVYYTGTEEQWNSIDNLGFDKEKNIKIHYNFNTVPATKGYVSEALSEFGKKNQLKLINSITLEEAVTSFKLTFNKPLKEFYLKFVGSLNSDTAVSDYIAYASTDSYRQYFCYQGNCSFPVGAKRAFFIHAKETLPRQWESDFSSGAIPTDNGRMQGISTHTTTPKRSYSTRLEENLPARYISNLNFGEYGGKYSFAAGSILEIYGVEAE